MLTMIGNSNPNLEKAASRSPSEDLGACPPNWLQGNPIRLKPCALYFCKAHASHQHDMAKSYRCLPWTPKV